MCRHMNAEHLLEQGPGFVAPAADAQAAGKLAGPTPLPRPPSSRAGVPLSWQGLHMAGWPSPHTAGRRGTCAATAPRPSSCAA